MTARQLPERPTLEQLERQAKDLLHAARTGTPGALARFRALPRFARVPDREFRAPPLIWAAEGSRSPHREGQDHAAVARLLLDAGSPLDWQPGAEPSEGTLDILAEWRMG